MKTPIFPIFSINCKDEIINKKEDIEQISKYNFVGNGFFISSDGLLATVAHVLKQIDNYNNYAFLDNLLYKINVRIRRMNEKEDVNHIDAAIGKIDNDNMNNCDYYCFKDVTEDSYLSIKGFSIDLIRNRNENHFNYNIVFNNDEFNFYEIKASFSNLNYHYNHNIITNNFFEIKCHVDGSLNKMSGSPVVNEDDLVVGIIKGGMFLKDGCTKGQVLYINIINDLILEL